jgi:hypothetical protein
MEVKPDVELSIPDPSFKSFKSAGAKPVTKETTPDSKPEEDGKVLGTDVEIDVDVEIVEEKKTMASKTGTAAVAEAKAESSGIFSDGFPFNFLPGYNGDHFPFNFGGFFSGHGFGW